MARKPETIKLQGDDRVIIVRKGSEQEKFWLEKGYVSATESVSTSPVVNREENKEVVPAGAEGGQDNTDTTAESDATAKSETPAKPRRGRRKKAEVATDDSAN